jgi:hypothetical protein
MTTNPKNWTEPTAAEPNSLTVCATSTLADYLAREAAHHARSTALRAGNKQALLAALAAAGVANLTVSFDGYGDSGQIESVDARRAEGSEVPLSNSVTVQFRAADWDAEEAKERILPLDEAVEWFVYEMLGGLHGGWEINDGAFGTVTVDVVAATITLDMNTRFIGSEQHLTTI